MSADSVQELVEKIHQFFNYQVETNGGLSEAAKESLTVALECIEQAYKIQRKPASNELLDMFRNSSQASQNSTNQQAPQPNPAQFIQNLASSILSSASASVSQAATSATTASATQADSSSNSGQQQQQATPHPPPPAPRVRKNASEAEKMAAESFKNQGNDYMKQDKYKEAYDCYTQAIDIDDNNAIYYSNRAAASSKLSDHQAALRDCQEAVQIDANYSKAYGRMGLAYASMDDHQRAKDAYVKAVELDPTNESYRNNLKIAEEKLAGESLGANSGAGIQNNMLSMLRSMMSNPEVMSMAMRSLQDPRMQNLFGLATGDSQAAGAASADNGQQQPQQQQQQASPQQQAPPPPPPPTQQQAQSEPQAQPEGAGNNNNNNNNSGLPSPGVNPADLFNLTSRLAGSANIDLVGAGQQLLSTIEQNNPDLVNNMRRMMSGAFMPPQNNNSDRNPPPGYS